MKCKECNEEKTKSPLVRGKHIRFCDKDGRIWNGKLCPDCYQKYNKERMRLSRLPKISTAVPSDV